MTESEISELQCRLAEAEHLLARAAGQASISGRHMDLKLRAASGDTGAGLELARILWGPAPMASDATHDPRLASDRATVLLIEVNSAHATLVGAVASCGPVFLNAQAITHNNALAWLRDDPSLDVIARALERYITARARLRMALVDDYAQASKRTLSHGEEKA